MLGFVKLCVTFMQVEKTLQRLKNRQQSEMYVTLSSIENRVGAVKGWQEILVAMGFRFKSEAANSPAAVFFPTSDPGNRLTQCSACLQSLLGIMCFVFILLVNLIYFHNITVNCSISTL